MLKKFQIHTIFRIPFGMQGLITLGKDVLNRFEKSVVICKLIFKKCKVTYVGQAGRLLNTTLKQFRCTGCTTYSTPAALQIRSDRCTDFGRTDARK